MKLFKPTVILLVLLLLAAMVMVPMVSAAPDTISPEKIKTDVNFVSVEKATSVAMQFVNAISASNPKFADWKGASVKKETTYYDLAGTVSAYSFDVMSTGKYDGYVMVSATRDNYPVLEFSKGRTPDSYSTLQNNAQSLAATEAASKQGTLGQGKPVYLGGALYLMQYPVQKTRITTDATQKSQNIILVDLTENQIIPQDTEGEIKTQTLSSVNLASVGLDEKNITRNLNRRKQDAQATWNSLDKVTSTSSAATSDLAAVSALYNYQKNIIDVPYFYWTHGCSPTSAAMVLGTWRNRGLTNLPDDDGINANGRPSGDPLNQALATEMGTGTVFGQEGWTWPWMISYGINRVMAVGAGYPYTSGNAVNTAYSWPAIQSEIDANRPFILSLFTIRFNPLSLWGHSYATVGYGYDSWGSTKYIEVYTTWESPTDTYITFGNWDGAMNTYVRPDYTYSITSSAGPGGSISPVGSVTAPIDTTPSFTITPDDGYSIDQILVDNNPVTQNPYTFPPVTADHTISATFRQVPASTEWNWATDGWGDWQHAATWSGGSGSEYGPVMVNNGEGNHGEHGADVSLYAGSTQASVWKTFTDPSGVGWNTITFKGLMTASDVPNGRWMTIDINNNQVFGGTASQVPPGNGVPFEIKQSFTQSPTVNVKITNGQSPAWGPRFAMHYYSVKLSRESTMTAMKAQSTPFVIPDGKGLVVNATTSDKDKVN